MLEHLYAQHRCRRSHVHDVDISAKPSRNMMGKLPASDARERIWAEDRNIDIARYCRIATLKRSEPVDGEHVGKVRTNRIDDMRSLLIHDSTVAHRRGIGTRRVGRSLPTR